MKLSVILLYSQKKIEKVKKINKYLAVYRNVAFHCILYSNFYNGHVLTFKSETREDVYLQAGLPCLTWSCEDPARCVKQEALMLKRDQVLRQSPDQTVRVTHTLPCSMLQLRRKRLTAAAANQQQAGCILTRETASEFCS